LDRIELGEHGELDRVGPETLTEDRVGKATVWIKPDQSRLSVKQKGRPPADAKRPAHPNLGFLSDCGLRRPALAFVLQRGLEAFPTSAAKAASASVNREIREDLPVQLDLSGLQALHESESRSFH
jgi:hypothetical protein